MSVPASGSVTPKACRRFGQELAQRVTCPAGVKGRGAALHQLFRHRFIQTLLREKLISEKKSRQLLNWKHSGFNLDAGDKPVHSAAGRQQLAEYLLRAPFSLEKITWVGKTKRVIYRSSRSWRTKRNSEVFTATGFLAAAIEHIPPKHQHTVRYYGRYSNKCRGMPTEAWDHPDQHGPPETVPPPPPDPPHDIEKRRGLGGVLDAGEAGARRVSPPGGAGESNHGADPRARPLPLGTRTGVRIARFLPPRLASPGTPAR